MRYLPTESQDTSELKPAEGGQLPDEDAFDVTAHLARADGEEAIDDKPYESITLKILRKIWRLVDPRLNGFGPGLLRLSGIALAAFLPAWGLARLTAALPPIVTGSIAGGIAMLVAIILVLRSRRSDNLALYSRLHLGLLTVGAMTMAGWLPQHLLMSLIGPMGVGYGAGSFVAIFVMAFFLPQERPGATQEAALINQVVDEPADEAVDQPADAPVIERAATPG